MANAVSLAWDLIARDAASPAFLRVAGAADKAATSTARAAAGIESSAARMSAVGAKLTKSLTVPLVGIGAVAVDQAAKFQKSMNVIAVATDQSQKQIASTSNGLLSVARKTGDSLSSLSDALYVVEKSGLRGGQALAVVQAAAEGAAAEGADLGTATQALTSIMASYGKSLGSPVQAENALIRGAGLAKTTYQDFADSLSNVVPIAAALHISFAQVAGAVDTLTQHGETAQRATDNLANLITNLAGQNNVASASLQQLGVNTIDLSKNLGERGLTGSLNLVLDAINKHGKDGEIVTSAFKQAAVATAGLQTEIDKMPPALQKQTKAFQDGTLSYTDYRKYVKSLGAEQSQLGLDFLTTVHQADGFNKQLTSGNSTVRTLAATLKTALGGVTGMRVALMLSGNSADQFKNSVDAVSKAAQTSGADVLGWAQTQDTLAQKMKVAKENLQVLAVEIGNALIPAITKIVGWVSSAVHWFENLSGTDKQIIGWSGAVLAALGPILAIGGRIGAAVAGLASFAGAAETTATRVQLATQRITVALAGAGLVYGSTQTGGIAGHIMGAVGGGLTGASIGSFFGPLGTAIGGVAGSLAGLGLSYLHTGDSAKAAAQKQQEAAVAAQRAIDAQKQAVDSLAASMQADNDKLAENTRLQVENDLQQKGAFTLAAKLGVSTKTITDAVLGNVQAQEQLAALAAKIESTPGLVGAGGTQNKNLADLNNLLTSEGVNLHAAALEADQYAQANGKLNLAARSVAAQFAMYGTSLNTATLIGKQNIAFINAHVAALLSQRAAGKSTQAQFDASIGTLRAQLTQYGYSTAQVDAFTTALRHVPASVLTDIEKHGVTPAEIQAIIDKYSQVPTYKNTNLTVSDHASGVIASVAADLRRLGDKTVTITEVFQSVQSSVKASQYANQLDNRATGGPVNDGWFTVGEQGYELGYKQGSNVQIFSNPTSRAMTGWDRVPGYAGGTSAEAVLQAVIAAAVAPQASTTAAAQSSFGAADWAALLDQRKVDAASAAYQKLAAELKALQAADAKAEAAAKAHALAEGASATAADAAAAKVKAADAGAESALSARASAAKTAYDTISQAAQAAASKAAAAASAMVSAVQSQVSALQQQVSSFVSTVTQGLTGDYSIATLWGTITSNAQTAADALQSAEQAVQSATPDTVSLAAAQQAQAAATSKLAAAHTALAAAQAAVASGTGTPGQYATLTVAQQAQTDAVTNLAAANTALQSAQQAVANTAGPTADQLTALAQAQTAYNQAIAANSVTGLENNLSQILASTQKFATDLNSLVNEGAGQDLISQLASMGSTAGDQLAQQLLAAGPGAINALQTTMTQIANVAGQEGDVLGQDFFGKGTNALQQLVAGMQAGFPSVKAALAPILAQLNAMFTFSPTVVNGNGTSTHVTQLSHTIAWLATNYHESVAALVAANPSLSGLSTSATVPAGTTLNVPSFASGVTNFAGGLAKVHDGELLALLPPRTSVIPRSKTPGVVGMDTEIRAVVSELRELNRRVDGLAGEIAESGVGLYETAGRATATAVRRAQRKGAY